MPSIQNQSNRKVRPIMLTTRKLLLGTLLASIAIPLAVFENIFRSIDQTGRIGDEDVYIPLRLHQPETSRVGRPTALYLSRTDNFDKRTTGLVQTDFAGSIVNPEDKNTFLLKSDKQIDILFLGGSTTENILITPEKRFPARVSTIVNRSKICANKNCKVINAGASGRRTTESINVLLNNYLESKPRVVILMHNINDLNYLASGGRNWSRDSHTVRINRYPLLQPRSYVKTLGFFLPATYARAIAAWDNFNQLISATARKKFHKYPQTDSAGNISEEYTTAEFSKTLDLFIAICRINNITPVLMTQPSRFSDKTLPLWQESKIVSPLHNKLNAIIRSKSEKALVMDLSSKIASNRSMLYDEVHLTEAGNLKAAKAISEFIVDKNIL